VLIQRSQGYSTSQCLVNCLNHMRVHKVKGKLGQLMGCRGCDQCPVRQQTKPSAVLTCAVSKPTLPKAPDSSWCLPQISFTVSVQQPQHVQTSCHKVLYNQNLLWRCASFVICAFQTLLEDQNAEKHPQQYAITVTITDIYVFDALAYICKQALCLRTR